MREWKLEREETSHDGRKILIFTTTVDVKYYYFATIDEPPHSFELANKRVDDIIRSLGSVQSL